MSRPLVIAHRGASARAPENTLPSFELAIASGADWIELDVQLSSDGVPMVFHDDDLARLTGSTGSMRDRNAAELSALEVSVAGRAGYSGATIPSLERTLREIGGDIPLYIELKSDGSGMGSERNRSLLDSCLQLLSPQDPHCIASFDPDLVRAAMDRGTPAVLIFAQLTALDSLSSQEAQQLFAWSGHFSLLGEGLAERAAENRRPLWIWTVDTEEEITLSLRAGAAGICSNDVNLARRVVDGISL